MNELQRLLLDIPPVSRIYLLAATLTSVLCALDYLSPLALYFNARLIARGQVWRVVTTFLYFGSPGLDFCLVRCCRGAERHWPTHARARAVTLHKPTQHMYFLVR
jgi:hypothetical protein